MLLGHALQLQSTHVMILGHKYMAISHSQPIVMILGYTHYRQLQSTHVTILGHILQGNYSDTHITRQLQSTHGMILGHTLQGNYSDIHITRQLQSTHVMILGRMHSKAITVIVASHLSTGWIVTCLQSVLLH